MNPPKVVTVPVEFSLADQLSIVCEKVGALAFGTVQLIVRDGRILEIHSTERTRLNPSDGKLR